MAIFFLGVLSSLLAGVIIYLFRYTVSPIVNLVFFRIFPKVSGKYLMLTDPELHSYENQRSILFVKQFANRIKGYIEDYSDEDLQCRYAVTGKVTQTRIIVISYDCTTCGHHDYGTAIFKLRPDGQMAQGESTSICNCCEKIDSRETILKKIETNA